MNKKKIIIISIIVIELIGIFIYSIINSIKSDQRHAKEIMLNILKNYNIYSYQIETYNTKREELKELITNEDVYYATFYENSIKINTTLEQYNKITNEIVNNNKYLNDNCKKYYADIEINNMCDMFNRSYKSIYKVFENDINSYNKTIKKYNEWVKKNNKFKVVDEYIIQKG